MNKKIVFIWVLMGASILAPQIASADFIVNQYHGYGWSGLAGVDAAIATGTPDATAVFDVIDFSDDPAFGGFLPFDNPWPLAGVQGTTNPLNQNFAANILGSIYIDEADTYTFMTVNDDGVRLRIDGTAIITDNGYHGEIAFFGNTYLDVGYHSLELAFFEGGGEASLELLAAQGVFAAYNPDDFKLVGATDGLQTAAIPEPTTILLLGFGLLGLANTGRRLRK